MIDLKICNLAYSFYRSFKVTYHLWQKQTHFNLHQQRKGLRFKQKKKNHRSVAFSSTKVQF